MYLFVKVCLLVSDPTVKEEANKKAYEKTLQTITTEDLVKDKPSERYGSKLKF